MRQLGLYGCLICAFVLIPRGVGAASRHQRTGRQPADDSSQHGEQLSAHTSVFGENITDSACQSLDRQAELAEIKAGGRLPYIFAGPEAQCSSHGCTHDYWGKRGRYDGSVEPSCPLEDRRRLAAWMADLADRGSAWAAEALTFKPCDLFPLLKGRTVWFVGDSMSQDMAMALVLFLTEYHSPEQRVAFTDNATALAELTASAAGVSHPSWCHDLAAATRVCTLSAKKAPRLARTVLPLLPSIADPDDIVIFNVGSWYNYHTELGKLPELESDLPPLAEALRALLPALPPRLLWREATAQHFGTPTGMWNGSVLIKDQRCAPPGSGLGVAVEMLPDGSLAAGAGSGPPADEWQLEVMLGGGHRNRVTQPVIDSLGIATLPAYNLSLVVDATHKNFHTSGPCVTVECDCTHVCTPSWFHMLMPQLGRALLGLEARLAAAKQQ